MNPLSYVLATIVLGLTATCASATKIDAPPTKTVDFAELDLTTDEGATQLFHRLRAAAKEVCSPMHGNLLMQRYRYHVCVNSALADAIETVNQPLVTMAAEAAGVKSLRVAAR